MTSDPDLDDLTRFIRKALDIQLSEPDEPLTEEALAKIARNAGLSDDDWKRVCRKLEEHLQKGRNFLTFENYGDAVLELEEAVALAPYRADVLCDCGKAHLQNWKERKVATSRERSEELLLKSLEIDPTNVATAGLLSEHRKPGRATQSRGKSAVLGAAILAAGLTAWIALTHRPGELADRSVEALPRAIQSGQPAELMARHWIWESGGELGLEADGTATHTEWKREGSWSLYPDGSIFLEAPTGTFRIEFREGVGHVRHLQRGGSTTIVPKAQAD